MTKLHDPDVCPSGHRGEGRVIDSRVNPARATSPGYRRRRHACSCGARWTSYESLIHPRRITFRVKRGKPQPVVVRDAIA
jgi:transcriptional regulator NrdR family protein